MQQAFQKIVSIGTEIHIKNHEALLLYIKSLARKIQYDLYVQFLCSNPSNAPRNELSHFFGELPQSFHSTKWIQETKSKDKYTINLSEDIAISSPWTSDRFIKSMSCIGENKPCGTWRKDSSNHYIELLMPFRIAWFGNGYHSGMTGILHGQGVAEADETYDATPLFDFMHTNGVHFYDTATGEKLSNVKHVEFAAIYELGRLLDK